MRRLSINQAFMYSDAPDPTGLSLNALGPLFEKRTP